MESGNEFAKEFPQGVIAAQAKKIEALEKIVKELESKNYRLIIAIKKCRSVVSGYDLPSESHLKVLDSALQASGSPEHLRIDAAGSGAMGVTKPKVVIETNSPEGKGEVK